MRATGGDSERGTIGDCPEDSTGLDPNSAARVARLLRWYPAHWRERYGDEFAAVLASSLSDGKGGLRLSFNVVREGMAARLEEAGFVGRLAPPLQRARASVTRLREVCVEVMRTSSTNVARVSVPLTSSAQFRWKSLRASSVRTPKIPSMRPGLNPNWASRTCNSAPSSPRRLGWLRYKSRCPRRQPASIKHSQVVSSTAPESGSPRER